MQLIFTRHGESEANVQRIISNRTLPHPLTATGYAQADALAEQLRSRKLRAIYSSPILRAQQTAQRLGEKLQAPVQIVDALREFDCGVAEGQGDAAAWQMHQAVVQAWDEANDYARCIPQGESYNDLRARFVPFVEQLIRDFTAVDDTLVLVSHGGLLHQMLPLVLTNIDQLWVKRHPLANCACVVTKPEEGRLVCLEWSGIALNGAVITEK